MKKRSPTRILKDVLPLGRTSQEMAVLKGLEESPSGGGKKRSSRKGKKILSRAVRGGGGGGLWLGFLGQKVGELDEEI